MLGPLVAGAIAVTLANPDVGAGDDDALLVERVDIDGAALKAAVGHKRHHRLGGHRGPNLAGGGEVDILQAAQGVNHHGVEVAVVRRGHSKLDGLVAAAESLV